MALMQSGPILRLPGDSPAGENGAERQHLEKGYIPMLTRVKTIAAAFVMTGFLAGAVAPTFIATDAAAQTTTQKAEKKAPAKKQMAKKKAPAKKHVAKKPAKKTKKAA